MEFPRVVAALAAFVGDIGLAEELAQDALVDALRQWPRDGVPRNPGAWLTAVGKRRAVDLFRRNRNLSEKYAQLGRELGQAVAQPADMHVDFDPESNEEIVDDRLRLMFVACHPVLPLPARTALTLRLVGGSDGSRDRPGLCRAEGHDRPAHRPRQEDDRRCGRPVRGPGGSGPDGTPGVGARGDLPHLSTRATRPPRERTGCAPSSVRRPCGWAGCSPPWSPEEPEVWGLVALMEFQSSRLRARIGPSGAPVLLLEQDRRAWDRLHIGRGEDALARADQLARLQRPLHAAGGDRRLPRPRLPVRGDRLGQAGRALRPSWRRRPRRRSSN